MSILWNPWHGCRKYSEGCRNCYVFRIDERHGKSGGEIRINHDFLLPLRKNGDDWKIPSGETVYTCFSSDFLLEEADEWRTDVWKMMKLRSDLHFLFFTKRIERLSKVLPPDWGNGYPNLTIGCTCENQEMADRRLPVFLSLPIAERQIVCEPLLSRIDLSPYLSNRISLVTVGGESGENARICDFAWVEKIHADCLEKGIPFHYHQTGAKLLRGGRLFSIPRNRQQQQAKRAGLDTVNENEDC